MKRWVAGLIMATMVVAVGSASTKHEKRKGYVPLPHGLLADDEDKDKDKDKKDKKDKKDAKGGPLTEVTPTTLGPGPVTSVCPPGCVPTVCYQTVTVYRNVTRTICETVPVRSTHEVDEVVCTPTTRKEPREEVYYEQKMVPDKIKRTVWKCVPEKQKVRYCVVEPKTRDDVERYTEMVPVTRKVPRTYTYTVPAPRTEERPYSYTVFDCVPVTKSCTTMTYSQVPVTTYAPAIVPGCGGCAPGCGSMSSACVPQTTYQTVCTPVTTTYTSYERKPRTVSGSYKVTICDYKTETKTVEESVTTCEPQEKTRPIKVTTYEQRIIEKDIDVQVMRPVEEEVPVMRCEYEKKTRRFEVEITEYKMSTRKVKRDFVTYQTVMRTICEKVPCTMTVPVVTYTPIAPPVCMPAPCGY